MSLYRDRAYKIEAVSDTGLAKEGDDYVITETEKLYLTADAVDEIREFKQNEIDAENARAAAKDVVVADAQEVVDEIDAVKPE